MRRDPFEAIFWLSKLTREVIVGVSGGKDSVATLDLCVAAGLTVHCYAMYNVPDLSFQTAYRDYLSERYGVSFWVIPHPMRAYRLNLGEYCAPNPDLPVHEFRDVWEAARKHFKCRWIATGEKKNDSLERRAQLSSWGAVQPARSRGFPLAEWSDKMVFAHLEKRGIKLAPDYEMFGSSLASPLDPKFLGPIKEKYPEDYERIVRDFPLAPAGLLRYQARQRAGVVDGKGQET